MTTDANLADISQFIKKKELTDVLLFLIFLIYPGAYRVAYTTENLSIHSKIQTPSIDILKDFQ